MPNPDKVHLNQDQSVNQETKDKYYCDYCHEEIPEDKLSNQYCTIDDEPFHEICYEKLLAKFQ